MFDADTYRNQQPHLQMKAEKVEDIRIARWLKKKRLRVSCITGQKEINCRMYSITTKPEWIFKKHCDVVLRQFVRTCIYVLACYYFWIYIFNRNNASFIFHNLCSCFNFYQDSRFACEQTICFQQYSRYHSATLQHGPTTFFVAEV
jgi:hypothetical protein